MSGIEFLYKKVWGQWVYLPLGNFNKCFILSIHVTLICQFLRPLLYYKMPWILSTPKASMQAVTPQTSSILPTSSCQHWAEGYICTLNYLDCHLCIFNAAVSFFPFMARWNTTVSPLHLPLCVEVRFRINEFSLKPSSGHKHRGGNLI